MIGALEEQIATAMVLRREQGGVHQLMKVGQTLLYPRMYYYQH